LALVAMIDPTVTDGKAALNYTGGVDVKTNLYLSYRNTLREFCDLVWNQEALNPMIDHFAAVITNFVSADRDRWKDHPLTGTAKSDFGPLEAVVTDMKKFAFIGGTNWPVLDRPLTSMVAPGGRAVELEKRLALAKLETALAGQFDAPYRLKDALGLSGLPGVEEPVSLAALGPIAPGGALSAMVLDTATELDRLDLIDEYRFLVHPRIAGHGPTLYQSGLPSTRRLELVSAKPLRSGAVAMHYRRAR